MRGVGEYRRLATTIDDAVGEAFDKAAKLLGLGYPGGPALEPRGRRRSERRSVAAPLVGSDEPFSFAGLKSAVQRAVASGDYRPADIAASFQQAVVDHMVDRTALALDRTEAASLVVAGGVAANRAVREALARLARREGRRFSVPPALAMHRQCRDDRLAGAERFAAGRIDGLDAPAQAR